MLQLVHPTQKSMPYSASTYILRFSLAGSMSWFPHSAFSYKPLKHLPNTKRVLVFVSSRQCGLATQA